MSLQNFGKKVRLEIYTSDGRTILTTNELRVDFDIRLLQGFNRAKFCVYNLNTTTIREINGGDRYIRMYIQLHDGPEILLADDYYINNSITEKLVPVSITSMFCIDKARKDFTSKQLKLLVKQPTLKRMLSAAVKESKTDYEFTYTDFPKAILEYKPVNPVGVWSGEVEGLIKKLGKEYGFTHHIKGKTIDITYRPLHNNVDQSGQSSRGSLLLDTSNMRANPVVGVAKLVIQSNLDSRIECNTMLDTSNLVTASSESGFEALTISKHFLKDAVSDYSLFSTLSVNHIGSTHTKQWTTKAIAIKAAKGTRLPTYNWYGG